MMQSKIRAALETRIAAFAKSKDLPVVWEGVEYKPEVDQTYLRVFIMRAASDSKDLAGRHRLYRGVFQVDVVGPTGQGMGDIEQLAGEIIGHCYKNLRLPIDSGFVQLTSVMSMGPKIVSGGSMMVPLTSYYRMDTV